MFPSVKTLPTFSFSSSDHGTNTDLYDPPPVDVSVPPSQLPRTEYLFVVGGGPRSIEEKTEIVSLTEGESIPECLNELADHPNAILYSAGGALPDAGIATIHHI